MRKDKYVTRTVKSANVSVLCMDVETAEALNTTVNVPSPAKDEKKLLEQVKRLAETDTIKVVHIVDITPQETLYGMTETEFVKHAIIMPKRKEENE